MKTCIYVGSNIQKITVKNMQSARKMGGYGNETKKYKEAYKK